MQITQIKCKKNQHKTPKNLQQQNICILESQIIFKPLLLIWDHITKYYEIMFTLDHSKLTYLGLPIITRMQNKKTPTNYKILLTIYSTQRVTLVSTLTKQK